MNKNRNGLELGTISLLIPACKDGNSQAREELFGLLRRYLYGITHGIMDPVISQKVESSDIVQASFLKIVQNFSQFRGETSGELKAWIKQIIGNEVRQARRHFKTQQRDFGREVSFGLANDDAHKLGFVDASVTPSSAALEQERNLRFHRVLATLNSDDAMVIRLRNLDELSFKEIAERMNRSEKACSQLWYRAILKFEKKLNESGEFDQ